MANDRLRAGGFRHPGCRYEPTEDVLIDQSKSQPPGAPDARLRQQLLDDRYGRQSDLCAPAGIEKVGS